ncbi:MAG: tRNA 2-thiocytidine(32) synthetase TtcA [Nitrospirae bacterium]|nr:tRNA 2-thiocytidine(32) synthetase TtcA [Nitrospirota bacterium]
MSKPKGTLKSLQTRLCRLVGQAIGDFSMIEHGDRVMVCLSGGKDSYGLLDILLALQKKAPIDFELIAVNVDQKQPGFPVQILPEYLTKLGVPFHIEEQDTYSVVKELIPEGKTMCSLCSRLRRGVLYRLANELGVTKIALGHHRDDLVETLFLNMFLKGNFASMPPKLLSQDGQHVVIRPLAYVEESDLASYASFNLETAVGRKKAVQAIGVHGEIQKGVVTLVVMSHFGFCQVRQEVVRTFVIQLPFLGSRTSLSFLVICVALKRISSGKK